MKTKPGLLLLLVSITLIIGQLILPALAEPATVSTEQGLVLFLSWVKTPSQPSYTNALRNGSFEEGWTDIVYEPASLTNQQPHYWTLTWIEPGQPLFDSGFTAEGVSECVHKPASQLPPNEQPGGPDALVLHGEYTYKVFFGGYGRFGTELRQTVTGLIPDTEAILTVPVQVHQQDGTPDYVGHAYSGAWLNGHGGWLSAGAAGDRTWYQHQVTITVPENGEVEVVIRFHSQLQVRFDFFTDDIRLMAWVNGS